MATHQRISEISPPPARRKRWWMVAMGVVLGLGLYAVVLHWVTGQVETDVMKSIRPLPAAMEAGSAPPRAE